MPLLSFQLIKIFPKKFRMAANHPCNCWNYFRFMNRKFIISKNLAWMNLLNNLDNPKQTPNESPCRKIQRQSQFLASKRAEKKIFSKGCSISVNITVFL